MAFFWLVLHERDKNWSKMQWRAKNCNFHHLPGYQFTFCNLYWKYFDLKAKSTNDFLWLLLVLIKDVCLFGISLSKFERHERLERIKLLDNHCSQCTEVVSCSGDIGYCRVHTYTGPKKDRHPYYINSIEMRSLWMEIKYF